jgi:four helix bundle protein
VPEKSYLAVEDLDVYRRLCQLHIDVCDLSHRWPQEERYELGSQARRSSNSSPAQLAEKNDDRHVRNKVEGVNRSRGEAGETIHHLFMARLKGYITQEAYLALRDRYKECIRMLNGLERVLERKLPAADRRWEMEEPKADYATDPEACPAGWPPAPDAFLTPDT